MRPPVKDWWRWAGPDGRKEGRTDEEHVKEAAPLLSSSFPAAGANALEPEQSPDPKISRESASFSLSGSAGAHPAATSRVTH